MVLQTIHRLLVKTLELERRLEPFFRPTMNYLLREPAAAVLQYLINFRRPDEHLALAQEKEFPWERESLDAIIHLMAQQMRGHFQGNSF